LYRDHEETLSFVEFGKASNEPVFAVFVALAVFTVQTIVFGPLLHEKEVGYHKYGDDDLQEVRDGVLDEPPPTSTIIQVGPGRCRGAYTDAS
jgi:hypothetical protein